VIASEWSDRPQSRDERHGVLPCARANRRGSVTPRGNQVHTDVSRSANDCGRSAVKRDRLIEDRTFATPSAIALAAAFGTRSSAFWADAQRNAPTSPGPSTQAVARAATAFLKALTAEQRGKVPSAFTVQHAATATTFARPPGVLRAAGRGRQPLVWPASSDIWRRGSGVESAPRRASRVVPRSVLRGE
jgi:hypothetical protein